MLGEARGRGGGGRRGILQLRRWKSSPNNAEFLPDGLWSLKEYVGDKGRGEVGGEGARKLAGRWGASSGVDLRFALLLVLMADWGGAPKRFNMESHFPPRPASLDVLLTSPKFYIFSLVKYWDLRNLSCVFVGLRGAGREGELVGRLFFPSL